MIDEGQTTDRINRTPNFFHFNNQQSSLDNHQSDGKNAVGWLTHTGREVPPSGLLRVVGGRSRVAYAHRQRSAALRAKIKQQEQPNSLTRGHSTLTPQPPAPASGRGGEMRMGGVLYWRILAWISGWAVGRSLRRSPD
jgi:hypothetical protein